MEHNIRLMPYLQIVLNVRDDCNLYNPSSSLSGALSTVAVFKFFMQKSLQSYNLRTSALKSPIVFSTQ